MQRVETTTVKGTVVHQVVLRIKTFDLVEAEASTIGLV